MTEDLDWKEESPETEGPFTRLRGGLCFIFIDMPYLFLLYFPWVVFVRLPFRYFRVRVLKHDIEAVFGHDECIESEPAEVIEDIEY